MKEVEEQIQDIIDEKSRLLIQAGNVSEAVLEKDFNDIKGLFEQKGRAEVRLVELNGELERLQKRMDELQKQMDELNPDSSQVKVYREVHRVLEEIAKAFSVAKRKIFADSLPIWKIRPMTIWKCLAQVISMEKYI